MMVHFRKRFPIEFVAKKNEFICTGSGAGGSNKSESVAEESAKEQNHGTLIMDATVADADIKYPTDIDLLNQCREHLETAIDLLWPYVPHEQHKYPYNRKKARRGFLNISKSKKWTRKKLRTGIGLQLGYIEKAAERLTEMQKLVPNWEKKFPYPDDECMEKSVQGTLALFFAATVLERVRVACNGNNACFSVDPSYKCTTIFDVYQAWTWEKHFWLNPMQRIRQELV